ncbi:MAG TPA: SMC-Scp complex subunit ScpB [Vicinamibacterales bacterium]|nr:SMC-Scp complex subunit ScpB [Vicinamibacterales bacterium]
MADFDQTQDATDQTPAPPDAGEGTAGEGAPDTAAAGQPSGELKAIVEALIFASPDPLTPKALFKLLASEPSEDVQAAIDALMRDYDRPGGLQLVQVAGGYQIVTRPELHDWVRRLFHERTTQRLSVQALETLATIAYKQPVTAAEIAEIRGVNTSGVLNTLIERQLIKISGRKQVVGRPFLYATTREFLIRFGLKDLSDLPNIEDMAEALGFEPPVGLVGEADRPAESNEALAGDADRPEGEGRVSGGNEESAAPVDRPAAEPETEPEPEREPDV